LQSVQIEFSTYYYFMSLTISQNLRQKYKQNMKNNLFENQMESEEFETN